MTEGIPVDSLTEQIIGAAIEVHQTLGPGLLESAYESCLCHELSLRGLPFRRQVELPVRYKNVRLECGYKIDVLVQELVVVELKAVEALQPVHDAQILTYLKLAQLSVGLLLNFHAPTLKQGLRRIVNNFQDSSASRRLGG